MKTKTFFIAVIAGSLTCFCLLAGLLAAADPFFVLRGVREGDTARFDNQRYQMAGLIRHQDYSAVVMGTSLVANYRASWFTQGLGEETLKITFPDGWISEFDTALELAFRTHPDLDKVYFGFDPNVLVRSDSRRTVELPRYLYNINPLDDVEYLLNAETYQEALRGLLRRDSGEQVPLDEAYVWDGRYTFTREVALKTYYRPDVQGMLPDDAFLPAARENLAVVEGWFQAHPDVEFVLWFPPYSILYWDRATREGTKNAILTATQYAAQRLLEYENVTLHSFLSIPAISDLDNYTDHIHCSGELTSWVARNLMAGEYRMDQAGLADYFAQLRAYVESYDYEALFPAAAKPA